MSAGPHPLVVISWWSNAIGLSCLRALAHYAKGRRLFVVQVGKTHTQKELFRRHLAPDVTELPYPENSPGEHARVLRAIALGSFGASAGVWFLDHDVFLGEPLHPWLDAIERELQRSDNCLCLPISTYGQSITQPAFWISPVRWPATIDSFDPIPYREHLCFRQPSAIRGDGELVMPIKDTLWAARDILQAEGRVVYFPVSVDGAVGALPRFPAHTHLGGLSMFAGPVLPPEWTTWMKTTATRFLEFYAACPSEWRAIEDDVLIRRCHEFSEV